MSTIGRLQDLMHEALISAPDPLHGDDPGPLDHLDRHTANSAVERATEVAWNFMRMEHGIHCEVKAERDHMRSALTRIYQTGHDEHVEIARAALDGEDAT